MTGQCCMGGPASRRSVRRLPKLAASILPGIVMVLLPKCPLCLAAWLTVATGIGFSAAVAGFIRVGIAALWGAAVILVLTTMTRRRSNPSA